MEKILTKTEPLEEQIYEPPCVVAILPLHLVFQGSGSLLFDSVSETACPVGNVSDDPEGICP